MKWHTRIPHLFACLAIASALLTLGCNKQSAPADTSTQSVDEKIKSIEKSDLPGPIKQKTIEKLRAQQGQTGQTK